MSEEVTTEEAAEMVLKEVAKVAPKEVLVDAVFASAELLAAKGHYDVCGAIMRACGMPETTTHDLLMHFAGVNGHDPALVFAQVWGLPAFPGKSP